MFSEQKFNVETHFCFRDGGTLDMPSSWRGGSVGAGYLYQEGGR